jgi:hypothetical protein
LSKDVGRRERGRVYLTASAKVSKRERERERERERGHAHRTATGATTSLSPGLAWDGYSGMHAELFLSVFLFCPGIRRSQIYN